MPLTTPTDRAVTHAALIATPAVQRQMADLGDMLRAYHLEKARRPVPAVTAEQALANLSAAIPA